MRLVYAFALAVLTYHFIVVPAAPQLDVACPVHGTVGIVKTLQGR